MQCNLGQDVIFSLPGVQTWSPSVRSRLLSAAASELLPRVKARSLREIYMYVCVCVYVYVYVSMSMYIN